MKNNILKQSAILITLLLASYLSVIHVKAYGLPDALWLCVIFPLFAYFLSINVVSKKLDPVERISYSAGLFVACLIALGLTLNTIGLIAHQSTLRPSYIIPGFDILFLANFFLFSKRRSYVPVFPAIHIRHITKRYIAAFIPIVFPFLGLVGTVQLNNGGSSFFAVTSLITIAIYECFFFLSKSKKSELIYIVNIFCVTLALIISYSMRSNHIIGYDINQEFQVFSAVLRNGIWQPHLISSTYNACLSITILPTVVNSFIQSSAEYVFKFTMQLVLCFVPIVVYGLAKRQLNSQKLAFLASLFFIVQAQFLLEFPALIRQQSAMLFFGLILLVASNSEVSRKTKDFLILLFGTSMVVSHYSTAYVCLAFLIIIVLLRPAFARAIQHLNSSHTLTAQYTQWRISSLTVLTLVIFSFCWYGQTLNSNGGIVQKVSSSISNFDKVFLADSRSGFIANDLRIGNSTYNTDTLKLLESKNKVSDSYPEQTYSNTNLIPTSVPAPNIDNKLQTTINTLTGIVMPVLVKVIVLVGAIVILLDSLRRKRSVEDGLIVVGAGILFVLLIALPMISQDYNVTRLYQQLLVPLATTSVIGVAFLLKKFPSYISTTAFTLIIVYFLCTSNLASQLTFGSSNMDLSNSGVDYYEYYVRDGEVESLSWLQTNQTHNKVNFDLFASLRAMAFTNIPTNNYIVGLLPSEITKNGYVYVTNTNMHSNLAFATYNTKTISYNFPSQFLDQQKNIVYANENSEIYK